MDAALSRASARRLFDVWLPVASPVSTVILLAQLLGAFGVLRHAEPRAAASAADWRASAHASGSLIRSESRERATGGAYEQNGFEKFAKVVEYINCDRAQRYADRLQWSDDLVDLASTAPKDGFVNDDESVWAVTWQGSDMVSSFRGHFDSSKSTYERGLAQTAGTLGADFMALVWRTARQIGCAQTSAGKYICCVKGSPRDPFLGRNETGVRQCRLTSAAACSQDRLCPSHGEDDEALCEAAGCTWNSGWTWCERRDKERDKDEVRATFEPVLDAINCQRKDRSSNPIRWDERNVDWAFKLTAVPDGSQYKHAFYPGGRMWDVAWWGEDASASFNSFLWEAESSFERDKSSPLGTDYAALISKISFKIGCFKKGKSNACVLRMHTPFTPKIGDQIDQAGAADCSRFRPSPRAEQDATEQQHLGVGTDQQAAWTSPVLAPDQQETETWHEGKSADAWNVGTTSEKEQDSWGSGTWDAGASAAGQAGGGAGVGAAGPAGAGSGGAWDAGIAAEGEEEGASTGTDAWDSTPAEQAPETLPLLAPEEEWTSGDNWQATEEGQESAGGTDTWEKDQDSWDVPNRKLKLVRNSADRLRLCLSLAVVSMVAAAAAASQPAL